MTDSQQITKVDARNSFTGKSLTDSQFGEGWALTEIIHRAILKTASFTEKLTDYAFAFSRSEKFDQVKAETIIRDLFKARYGETMNQMRERLLEREANLPKKAKTEALSHAHRIEPMIRDGQTMPFYGGKDHWAARPHPRLGDLRQASGRIRSDRRPEARIHRSALVAGRQLRRSRLWHSPAATGHGKFL